jgi:exosortase
VTASATAKTAAPSSPAPQPGGETPAGPLVPPHVWARIALLAALFVPLHWNILYRLGRIAYTDGNWSHAFLIPFISLYFISQHKDALRATPPRPSWPGLAVAMLGLAGYVTFSYPAPSDMLAGYSMILELFGLVLLLVGPRVMKLLWFPIFYLVFAVKVSQSVWEAIAWQLQNIAASSSAFLLGLLGVDAQIQGTTIELYRGSVKVGNGLNVAEACSGLRMLMTFIALGVAMAYLWERPWWARLTLVLLTLPIAILVNVGRVTSLALIYLVAPEYSRGDFHIFMGMLMLIPAGLLFWIVGWVLSLLADDDVESASKSPAA